MRLFKWLIGGLTLVTAWTALMLFGATEGWFRKPIAPAGDARAFATAAIAELKSAGPANVAFVLVQRGRVFDTYYSDGVGPDTLFPVASMSKWLTAYGVMTLVAAGKIELDAPIAPYLVRWKLPDGGYDDGRVTTRMLLSHTAGLTDRLGFGDYAADEPVPGIVESLEHPRASSGQPVVIGVGRVPGSEWEYSGGGYLILQLLVEDVSGLRFDDYMQRIVFTPLGMSRSTYEFIGDHADVAASLTTAGEVAPFYRYAAAGATGLSTTASDMLRFIGAQSSGAVDAPLPPATVARMRAPEAFLLGAPIWGLGTMLFAPTAGGDFVFGHAGQNEPAINADARVNPDTGDGVVVSSPAIRRWRRTSDSCGRSGRRDVRIFSASRGRFSVRCRGSSQWISRSWSALSQDSCARGGAPTPADSPPRDENRRIVRSRRRRARVSALAGCGLVLC